MSNYINNLADSRLKGDNEQNNILLHTNYFDRNNLRGNKTELDNQLKDITAHVDYGKVPQQSRQTVIDKLDEGSPQDKLNEKQYSLEMSSARGQEYDTINPYMNPYSQTNRSNDSERDYGNRFPYSSRWGHRRNTYGDRSLTKTIVIVIILLVIFYLLLVLMFRDRDEYQAAPGNMNLYFKPPSDEANQ